MAKTSLTLEKIAGEDFLKIIDEMKEYESKIPKDKDCKKCPYSENGHSLGMRTPCFDICDGFGVNIPPKYAR